MYIAHCMTLLGDGEVRSDDSIGLDTADMSSPEPWQSEQESDGRDTTGAKTSARELVAVTPVVVLLPLPQLITFLTWVFSPAVANCGSSMTYGRRVVQWQFDLGDIVWARLKPFPPWPAVISCNPKSCAWRRGDQYRQVVFFGDYTHRVCLWVIWLHSTGNHSSDTHTHTLVD